MNIIGLKFIAFNYFRSAGLYCIIIGVIHLIKGIIYDIMISRALGLILIIISFIFYNVNKNHYEILNKINKLEGKIK